MYKKRRKVVRLQRKIYTLTDILNYWDSFNLNLFIQLINAKK
jgi:hypothetical protein